jgi:5'-methylthioadenosine phosphorylase
MLRDLLARAGRDGTTTVHHAGTYVCMEGPQFSTRAESQMHRQWGGDVIGMTASPEAKLAREAELCYALIALPTDYDCWRPHDPGRGHDELLGEILGNLERAGRNAIELLHRAVKLLADPLPPCGCREALRLAIWTDRKAIEPGVRKKYEPLLRRYLTD